MHIIRQILPEDGIIADYRYNPETDKGRFLLYIETDKGFQRMAFDPNTKFVQALIEKARKLIIAKD
jgi:hypothetical protein